MEFCYKINSVFVLIDYKNPGYLNYFEKEFGLLKVENNTNADKIKIHIVEQRYVKGKNMKIITDNLWIDEKATIQKLQAFRREIWIRYNSIKDITLYLDYDVNEKIERFLNPFYESRAIACLNDFFHNAFLIILQLNLINCNGALLHCSSFIDIERNYMYTLCGTGQVGKSTLMQAILEDGKRYNYCAEDFAVVFSDGMLYGYPHECRVKESFFQDPLYYDMNSPPSLGDRINYFVYHKILKRGNGRHFAVRALFPKVQFQSFGALNDVYLLNRDSDEFLCEAISLEDFVSMQKQILSTEFSNMVMVRELLIAFKHIEFIDYDFEELMSRITKIYEKAFSHNVIIYQVYLPIYPDVHDATRKLIERK